MVHGVATIVRREEAPRSEYGLHAAVAESFNDQAEVGRIVFQIGVLNDDQVSFAFLQPTANRGPFATVSGHGDKKNSVRVPISQLSRDLGGAVGRSVIDKDELLGCLRELDGENLFDDCLQRGLL